MVNKFKAKFFSKTSARARECKREYVLRLAQTVKGSKVVIPLDKTTVEGVAAAMKETGMKSGTQYLAELKMLHIEAGYDLPAWLKRVFDLCKRGLEREKGPTKRAAAVKVEECNLDKINAKMHRKGWPLFPVRAFLWAAIWMLREIELRNMKLQHVELDKAKKQVSIFLPLSKCDQEGLGVKRTLACCNESPCNQLCPCSLAEWVLKRRSNAPQDQEAWLFPSKWNLPASKTGIIDSWRGLFDNQDISGHSGRRSGAMMYVRRGLQIQELAFLGRWRSSVVLSYAQEALQDCAVRVPQTPTFKQTEADLKDLHEMKEDMDKIKADLQDARKAWEREDPKHQAHELAQSFSKPGSLWVKTKGRGMKDRPCHLVTRASWTLDVSDWSTACGWFFAQKSKEFSFIPFTPKDKVLCSKCKCMCKDATMSEREGGVQLDATI